MVAYQPGKAAKSTAPATISHASLPSQTGPIVLTMTRRSSACARERVQPEVESLQDEKKTEPDDGGDDEPEISEIESSHVVDLLVDEGQVVLVLMGRVGLSVGG